jgi:hypothetical protein
MLLRPTSLAIAAALALGAPIALANPEPTPIAEHQVTPRPASQPETSRYAQREHRDQKQVANYEGGSIVVVGISGGALLVILVLLLILA